MTQCGASNDNRRVATRSLDVLLVEDSVADVELSREALAETGHPTRLHTVPSGEEAIELLERAVETGEGMPDLVLLDLNLPGLDGHRVLRWIRQNEALCSVPVVILSSSSASRDVAQAYGAGASGYVMKPQGFDALREKYDTLIRYWRDVVLRPRD